MDFNKYGNAFLLCSVVVSIGPDIFHKIVTDYCVVSFVLDLLDIIGKAGKVATVIFVSCAASINCFWCLCFDIPSRLSKLNCEPFYLRTNCYDISIDKPTFSLFCNYQHVGIIQGGHLTLSSEPSALPNNIIKYRFIYLFYIII